MKGQRKVLETSDMAASMLGGRILGYQRSHKTYWRTSGNETKATPIIRIYRFTKLTGDCLSWNA